MPNATHAYLQITGKHQGVFKGGISRPGHGDNWLELLAFENTPPRDRPSGMLAGKRQHGTLSITRATGEEAALFFKALATKEPLPEVEIEFVNQHGNGAAFLQNSATLTGATIVKIEKTPPPSSPKGPRNWHPRGEYVRVSFIYRQITWTYKNGSKADSDSWCT
jgi:type VI secretion system Hcp family effector